MQQIKFYYFYHKIFSAHVPFNFDFSTFRAFYFLTAWLNFIYFNNDLR